MSLVFPGEKSSAERTESLVESRKKHIPFDVGSVVQVRYEHRVASDLFPGLHNQDSHGVSFAEATVVAICYGEAGRDGGTKHFRIFLSCPNFIIWHENQLKEAKLDYLCLRRLNGETSYSAVLASLDIPATPVKVSKLR